MSQDVDGDGGLATGDRLQVLRALQQRLAAELADARGAAVAQVAHQLRMVAAEIAELAPNKEVSVVDEIAARRSRRKAAARESDAARP